MPSWELSGQSMAGVGRTRDDGEFGLITAGNALFIKWYPNVVAVVKGNTELVISSSDKYIYIFQLIHLYNSAKSFIMSNHCYCITKWNCEKSNVTRWLTEYQYLLNGIWFPWKQVQPHMYEACMRSALKGTLLKQSLHSYIILKVSLSPWNQ